MATLIFAGGMEQGTAAGLATGANLAKYFDRVVGTTGTNVEVVGAAARSGDYGLRLSPTAAIAHCGWFNNANNGILGSAGTLVGSFTFRFPSALPSGDFNIALCYGTAGGQDFFLKYLTSTGSLQAVVGSATQLGPTIAADTWYRVDFRLVLDANPHTLDWQINGSAQTQVSHAVASENIFAAGFSTDNATQSGTMHIDDALLSLTSGDYPLGAHKVLALTVDGSDTVTLSGTAGNFQTFSGATPTMTAWNATTARGNVDERPPNLGSSQDGFAQITLATGDYVQTPMTTYTLAGGETISGARLVACCWAATTSAATIGFRSHNGTTETTLFAAANPSANNTSTPAWVCKMLTLADINTQGELDALAIRTGFSGDATPDEGVHAIYVEVAILEATGTSASAECATASGAAQDASITATVGPSEAAATGTAADSPASLSASPAEATATGTANDSTVDLAPTAEAALATGAAPDPGPTLAANAGEASGSGTAEDPNVSTIPATSAPAECATATGDAYDPATSITLPALEAIATGAALDPQLSLEVLPLEASATVAANDATVTTVGSVDAAAECATAIADSLDPAVSVGVEAGESTAAGSAIDPAFAATTEAQLAAGTGLAETPDTQVAIDAAVATGSAAADDAVIALTTDVDQAQATGIANDAVVTVSGNTTAQAECATASGVAEDAAASIGADTEVAAATAEALQPSADLVAEIEAAFATAEALDAVIGLEIIHGTGVVAITQPAIGAVAFGGASGSTTTGSSASGEVGIE